MLVCPTTPYLQLDEGIAHAISAAAGPGFKTRCNEYVENHGRLKVFICNNPQGSILTLGLEPGMQYD